MDMDGTWLRVKPYEDRYRYNHKELTKGLGWYAYGARYYDAAIGRFAGVDPIGDRFPHVTTYNYAEDSPIGNIDLWGLQKFKVTNNMNIPTTDKTGARMELVDPHGDLKIDYYEATEDGEDFVTSSTEYRNEVERRIGNQLVGSFNEGRGESYTFAKYYESIVVSPVEPVANVPVLPTPPTPISNGFQANSDILTGGGDSFIRSVANDLDSNPSLNVTIWAESNRPEFDADGNPLALGPSRIGGRAVPNGALTTRQLLMARGQEVQNRLISAGIDPSRIVFAVNFNTSPRTRVVYR